MKCLICGEKTNNQILCGKHTGVDNCLPYLKVHICQSFMQKKGGPEGVCQNRLLCAPIKRALKHEILFNSNLGHVICPHAATNLREIVYSEVNAEEIKSNYPECLG
jgi:hypothetical protein